MLTEEEKKNNAEKYVRLLGLANIDSQELIDYLMSIAYFDAPATMQYEGSYPGGLCEYTLKFAHELGVLCHHYFPGKYSNEDVLKVALFKELYRAEMYEAYNKNVKNDETGDWETVRAYKMKADRPVYGELGFSSYMIAKHYVSFSDEQIEAIIHSSGMNNFSPDIHEVMKAYPLVSLARMADTAVSNL